MCVGDNPIERAMPYLVSAVIFAVIALLLHIIPHLKKNEYKFVSITKIITIIISAVSLLLALNQYLLRTKC